MPLKANCYIQTWNKKKLVSTAAVNREKLKVLNHREHARLRLHTPFPIPVLPFVIVQTSPKNKSKSLRNTFFFLSHGDCDLRTRGKFIQSNSSISIKHSPKPPMVWVQTVGLFWVQPKVDTYFLKLRKPYRMTNISIYIFTQRNHSPFMVQAPTNTIQSSTWLKRSPILLFQLNQNHFIYRMNCNFKRRISIFTEKKTTITINQTSCPLCPPNIFFSFCLFLFFLNLFKCCWWAYGLWGSY